MLAIGTYIRSLLLLSIALICHTFAGAQTHTSQNQSTDKPILNKKQVPVLCYHQVRSWKRTDSKNARPFIVPPETFKAHMKMLHDSGYHTISPDQLNDYLTRGKALPGKPVLLTFDDGTLAQYTEALPVLEKYGFTATFFIMTVTLNKPDYLSRSQVKELSDKGNEIGCHTWDHHKVTQYTSKDWDMQLTEPTHDLQLITGKKVNYFAYPFGIWNKAAIEKLKELDYKASFQLSGAMDIYDPRYTIRRIIADGQWNATQLHSAIVRSFK